MELISLLHHQKIVPIIRTTEPGITFPLVEALYHGGMTLIEVTLTIPDALATIRRIREELPSVVIGVGTVRDEQAAQEAVAMGAHFLVTYKPSDAVARIGQRSHVPYILGGMTPAEIDQCLMLGSTVVKVFPANLVGPEFLAAIRGPFPGAQLLPTGGIREPEVSRWLEAGAIAVGVGGDLLRLVPGPAPDYGDVTRRAAGLLKRAVQYTSVGPGGDTGGV